MRGYSALPCLQCQKKTKPYISLQILGILLYIPTPVCSYIIPTWSSKLGIGPAHARQSNAVLPAPPRLPMQHQVGGFYVGVISLLGFRLGTALPSNSLY